WSWYSSSRSAMRAKIAGWVISFSRASLDLSAKTMSARACRSIWPSGGRTPGPKCSRILPQAGSPGMTICLAMWSASMISAPRSASMAETVLLPEAMPPVSPTSSMPAAPSRYVPADADRPTVPPTRAGRMGWGGLRPGPLLPGVLALEVLDDVLECVVARLLAGVGGGGVLGLLAHRGLVLGRLRTLGLVAPPAEPGL